MKELVVRVVEVGGGSNGCLLGMEEGSIPLLAPWFFYKRLWLTILWPELKEFC